MKKAAKKYFKLSKRVFDQCEILVYSAFVDSPIDSILKYGKSVMSFYRDYRIITDYDKVKYWFLAINTYNKDLKKNSQYYHLNFKPMKKLIFILLLIPFISFSQDAVLKIEKLELYDNSESEEPSETNHDGLVIFDNDYISVFYNNEITKFFLLSSSKENSEVTKIKALMDNKTPVTIRALERRSKIFFGFKSENGYISIRTRKIFISREILNETSE